MGSLNFILDTNVVICLQKGLLAEPLPHGINGISIITEIELRGFHGLSLQQENWLNLFLNHVLIVDLDRAIKEETIRLRRTTRIKLPDAIIAATAIIHGAVLLTNDEQLFGVPGLVCRKLALKA